MHVGLYHDAGGGLCMMQGAMHDAHYHAALPSPHYHHCTVITALQSLHCDHCTAITALQSLHYHNCTAITALPLLHCHHYITVYDAGSGIGLPHDAGGGPYMMQGTMHDAHYHDALPSLNYHHCTAITAL